MDDNNNSNQPNREELLNQVSAQVVAKILLKVSKELTDQDVDEIEKLNQDDKEGKKVLKYLYEKVPNLDTIIFQELHDLRQ